VMIGSDCKIARATARPLLIQANFDDDGVLMVDVGERPERMGAGGTASRHAYPAEMQCAGAGRCRRPDAWSALPPPGRPSLLTPSIIQTCMYVRHLR
jgi:hypothetical protein